MNLHQSKAKNSNPDILYLPIKKIKFIEVRQYFIRLKTRRLNPLLQGFIYDLLLEDDEFISSSSIIDQSTK
jgi:hypothetical protein